MHQLSEAFRAEISRRDPPTNSDYSSPTRARNTIQAKGKLVKFDHKSDQVKFDHKFDQVKFDQENVTLGDFHARVHSLCASVGYPKELDGAKHMLDSWSNLARNRRRRNGYVCGSTSHVNSSNTHVLSGAKFSAGRDLDSDGLDEDEEDGEDKDYYGMRGYVPTGGTNTASEHVYDRQTSVYGSFGGRDSIFGGKYDSSSSFVAGNSGDVRFVGVEQALRHVRYMWTDGERRILVGCSYALQCLHAYGVCGMQVCFFVCLCLCVFVCVMFDDDVIHT
jgi:hypothetical protein